MNTWPFLIFAQPLLEKKFRKVFGIPGIIVILISHGVPFLFFENLRFFEEVESTTYFWGALVMFSLGLAMTTGLFMRRIYLFNRWFFKKDKPKLNYTPPLLVGSVVIFVAALYIQSSGASLTSEILDYCSLIAIFSAPPIFFYSLICEWDEM